MVTLLSLFHITFHASSFQPIRLFLLFSDRLTDCSRTALCPLGVAVASGVGVGCTDGVTVGCTVDVEPKNSMTIYGAPLASSITPAPTGTLLYSIVPVPIGSVEIAVAESQLLHEGYCNATCETPAVQTVFLLIFAKALHTLRGLRLRHLLH